MTLHRKIVVLLAAGITLYTIVGFCFHQFLILPRFVELEREEAGKNMRRCLEALASQIDKIDLLCFDWAAWDDTYEFIVEPNDDYHDSNLIPESFTDNSVNFIYFFRPDGSLVWGAFYDLEQEAPVPFPDLESGPLPPDHPLLQHSSRASKVTGVMSSTRGPLLVASRPILPSEAASGENIRGTLLMGRVLDDEIIDAIRQQAQVSVEVLDIHRDPLPRGSDALKTDEIRIIVESPVVLRVLSHVHDIQGKDLLLFHLISPRTILARGRTAIQLNGIAAGVAGFLFLLMLLFSLKWVITDPLERLSAQVKNVKLAESDAIPKLPDRRDEIGELAREFHLMLQRLRDEEADLVAAEAALRVSEARVKSILNTAPDAIFTLKADGSIETANIAAASLFGCEPDDFAGMPSAHLIAEDERDAWATLLQRYQSPDAATHVISDGESVGLRRDGSRFPIHVNLSSLELEGDRYAICDIRDISGLKSMQDKVARSQHLATIGEMGASVAHEIRNPLAGIKGALQVLSRGGLPAHEVEEVAGAIEELVDRIAHTVDQLLGYAKPLSPKRERVNVRALIEAVATAPPEGALVEIACEAGLVMHADPRLLQRVFENIWRNACQSLDEGGALRWEARREDDVTRISLQNDGPPIPDAAIGHVFDPFFTTRVDGTGLGLSVSLRIVEAHGGTMRVMNIGERGVLVEIQIPSGA